jgi:hypothetical protein
VTQQKFEKKDSTGTQQSDATGPKHDESAGASRP